MLVARLDFELPEDRIASRPLPERDAARLLVLDPAGVGATEESTVRALPELLPSGALVIANDTRVLPARLVGRRAPSGGRVELLLVEPLDAPDGATSATVRALGRPLRRLRPGVLATFGAGGDVVARVLRRASDPSLLEVELTSPHRPLKEALALAGRVPLPPYLGREDDAEDRERYQTIFARAPGAIAAPTAGLHLTLPLLARLEARGIAFETLTLHVGLGTFQPVSAADLRDHRMHSERFAIPERTAHAVAAARARGAPVVAIGTTVVRALESAACPSRPGHVRAGPDETALLIQPGFTFRVVDALLTNFHLPRSTLLALVCAFGGVECVLSAYARAVARGFRFYSYGDAMLLRSRAPAAARGSPP